MAWTTPRTWVTGELVTASLLNTHIRDNQNAAFPNGAAYSTWSPALTALTEGNGTETARYIQIGDWVFFYYRLLFGSSSAVTGSVFISLPVNPTSSVKTNDYPAGTAVLKAGGVVWRGIGLIRTDSTLSILADQANDTYLKHAALSSTVPGTWTTNDIISVTGKYEAA